MELERHWISACWPDNNDAEQQAMRDSIGNSGLREPIMLFEGKILDGWQRFMACRAENIAIETVHFVGDEEDAIEYVRDKHTRRPLTVTQRMTCIALMHERRPPGRPKTAVTAVFQEPAGNGAPGAPFLKTEDLARQAGGSERTAKAVSTAINKGAPELIDAMKNGGVSAKEAEQIAKLPKDEQPAAIAKPSPRPSRKSAVEPEPDAKDTRIAELVDQVNTLSADLADAREEIDSLTRITDAGDMMVVALSEAKKYRELAAGLKRRVSSMANEIASLKRQVTKYKKREAAGAA